MIIQKGFCMKIHNFVFLATCSNSCSSCSKMVSSGGPGCTNRVDKNFNIITLVTMIIILL